MKLRPRRIRQRFWERSASAGPGSASNGKKLRLAIVGCGAITRENHLPAVVQHPGVDLVALVDSDTHREKALAQRFQLDCRMMTDYRAILRESDAIINALPNDLHAQVSLEALDAGVHVLCEKPLATTAADARACCEKAEERKRILAVGMNRRFFGSQHLLHLILREGSLGVLRRYDWAYGGASIGRALQVFIFRTRALEAVSLSISASISLTVSTIGLARSRILNIRMMIGAAELRPMPLLELRHEGKLGEIKGRLRVSRTYPLGNRLLVRGSMADAEILSSDPRCGCPAPQPRWTKL